jgi:hypothetical protein
MKGFLNRIKKRLKDQSVLIAKFLGIELLDWSSTKSVLSKNSIAHENEKSYLLPTVIDIADANKIIFPEKEIIAPETYVWKFDVKRGKASLLRNGSLSINGSVLDTDFGNLIVLKDRLKLNKRTIKPAKLVIAPWSHYWAGYYDYVYFVVAKLVRMKQTMSDNDWNEALVAYPMMHTSFEDELLTLIGFRTSQVVDTRITTVPFETCLLGNSSSWFYPNSTDILALKKLFQERLIPNETSNKRIYISRAGRRKVNNEPALIAVLQKYDFTIIEDKQRTIAEQAEIYYNASILIGPHGASFANIIWCKPGTRLIELFPVNYMPEYFRYLAHILDLNYSAYCFYPIQGYGLVDHSFVNDDVDVNVDHIDRFLSSII